MLTVATTTVAGVGLSHRPAPLNLWYAVQLLQYEPLRLFDGVAFSGPLLFTLLAHEMGHYWVARLWRIRTSWPFFVPMPVGLGTMGALIRLDNAQQDRRAMLEIGAAGPLVGFVVAFGFVLVGLGFSEIKTSQEMATFISLGGLQLPDSGAYALARWLVFGTLPPEREVVAHPIALAGWFGLYLTWFNLLPFGQLDGGHMAYAAWPRVSVGLSVVVLGACAALGFGLRSPAWLAVGAGLLLLALMSGITHPPPPEGTATPGVRQRAVLVACVLVFLLCFVADPMLKSSRWG
ncbi:MAG: site-2 protease family protein [Myxococcota bacterium]